MNFERWMTVLSVLLSKDDILKTIDTVLLNKEIGYDYLPVKSTDSVEIKT